MTYEPNDQESRHKLLAEALALNAKRIEAETPEETEARRNAQYKEQERQKKADAQKYKENAARDWKIIIWIVVGLLLFWILSRASGPSGWPEP
jgi:cytoskeletal protein RodZ